MSNSKNIWGKLCAECGTLHDLIYEKRDVNEAKRRLPKLEGLLNQLPDVDEAIIRAEAFALYHEISGEPERAVLYRRREVELMRALYEDIRVNEYDDETKRALLKDRDEKELEVRMAIISALEQRLT